MSGRIAVVMLMTALAGLFEARRVQQTAAGQKLDSKQMPVTAFSVNVPASRSSSASEARTMGSSVGPDASRMATPSASRAAPITAMATYPGTDVEIKYDGVTFPIEAECPVGEAGKTCDGTETNAGVTGMIKFTQTDLETIEVEYEVKGLTPGLHGFHIHEKADFSNGCASAGPHYNPFGKTHGGPEDLERHVGDLGNIEADKDGVAKGKITDKLIKMFGEYTVAGRSIMIHADPDDLGQGPLEGWPEVPPPPAPAQHTKTTGNAGARIGCGVITLK